MSWRARLETQIKVNNFGFVKFSRFSKKVRDRFINEQIKKLAFKPALSTHVNFNFGVKQP